MTCRMTWRPRFVIGGPLRIMERIGAGSNGEVFRAWDESLDREVALKLLTAPAPIVGRDSRVVEEGRLLARIRHPNVAAVYGAERRGETVGIWMEFIRGRTLAEMISSDGPFSAEEAALIGVDVCRAVAVVHAAGLVHGDVKAQNIIRETGGRLVLSDFGAGVDLARAQDRQTLKGTPVYIAPEILEGAGPSPSSDVYAIGVLLFFLVSGKYPVEGANLHEVRRGHEEGRRRLQDERPDLPSWFTELLERALDPDLTFRFRSPAEMIPLLQRRHQPPLSRGAKQVALGCLVVLAISGWLVFSRPNAETDPQATKLAPSVYANADGSFERTLDRARQSLAQRTPAGFREALLIFEQVVSADPVNARALAGIADTYSLLGAFGVIGKTEANMAARDAAQKSIRLGPELPDGHASMSFVAWERGDRAEAFKHVTTALDMDPGYAQAHHWHALYLMDSGHFQDAIDSARRARVLDPKSPVMASDLALILRVTGRFGEALALLQELVQSHADREAADAVKHQFFSRSRINVREE